MMSLGKRTPLKLTAIVALPRVSPPVRGRDHIPKRLIRKICDRALPDTNRCPDFIVSRQGLGDNRQYGLVCAVWRSREASEIAPEAKICPVAPRNRAIG